MYGKKAMGVDVYCENGREGFGSCLKNDVRSVAKNMACMGRLLRENFELHFAENGHKCWLGKASVKAEITAAPLYYPRHEGEADAGRSKDHPRAEATPSGP